MLRYNFDRVFKARGIEKRFSYLKRAGFTENFAAKISKNKVTHIRLQDLEKLCLLLRCSPNDFFEWTPETETEVEKDHPINNVRKPEKIVDITKTLNAIPINQLDKIEQLIKEQLKTGEA